MKRFAAAHVKCVKMFFGFARLDSVTAMFCELGLPTCNTIVHNAKYRLTLCTSSHANALVMQVRDFCTGSQSAVY